MTPTPQLTSTEDADRRGWRALAGSTGAWIVGGALVALANTAYVTRNAFDSRSDPWRFVAVTLGALIMAGQIALAATLIRRYRIQARLWSVIAGGLTGLAMPVLLFVLFWNLSRVDSTAWWHQWVEAAAWTMIGCSATLLGIGLLSGVALGYAASGET